MKSLLLSMVFILIVADLSAQSAREKRRKEIREKHAQELFSEVAEAFTETEVPEKWTDEDAVILMEYHVYHRDIALAGNSFFKHLLRRRIKIQNEAALEVLSEFYFEDSEVAGFTIIHADGSEEDIDIEQAVEVETNVPKFWKSAGSSGGVKYKKIAIPNLRIGDIIDYFYYTEDKGLATYAGPYYFFLREDYSILKGALRIECNSKTYTGIRQVNVDLDMDTEEYEKKMLRHSFEYSDMERMDDEPFTFDYLTYPHIKFVMRQRPTFSDKELKNEYDPFYPDWEKDEKKSWELLKMPRSGTSAEYFNPKTNNFHRSLPKDLSNEDYADKAYYYLRRLAVENDYNQQDDVFFVEFMYHLLAKRDIPHEIWASPYRQVGSIDNIFDKSEVEYFLKVDIGRGEQKMYFAPYQHGTPEYFNKELLNEAVIICDELNFGRADRVRFEKEELKPAIDVSVLSEEYFYVEMIEENGLDIEYNHLLEGSYKRRMQLLLLRGLYELEDEIMFYGSERKKYRAKQIEQKEAGRKQRSTRVSRSEIRSENLNAEIRELKFEMIEEWIEDDFELKELHDFRIVQDGRGLDDTDELIYELEYEISNLVSKAGPNIVVELGKFVTDPASLETINKEREFPAYFTATGDIVVEIDFLIPESYKVEGLENFTYNVQNDVSGFESSAIEEEGKIKLQSRLSYKKDFISLEEWPLFAESLQAEFDLHQTKIVLKKN